MAHRVSPFTTRWYRGADPPLWAPSWAAYWVTWTASPVYQLSSSQKEKE